VAVRVPAGGGEGGAVFRSLDAFTLVFVAALCALFLAVVMTGIHLAGNRERAVRDWALAGVFFCVGHLVGLLTMVPASPAVSVIGLALANGAIALGHGMVLLGIQDHLRRDRSTRAVVLLGLLVVLLILTVPLMQHSVLLRVGLISMLYTAIAAMSACWLFQGDDRPLRRYRAAVAAVLIGYAGFLCLRFAYLLLDYGLAGQPERSPVLAPVFLASVLFYLGLAGALALLLFRYKEIHLQYLARHDALTGLLNRYSLEDVAERELIRASRSQRPLSVVALDLDWFKQVNDGHGHAAGDFVLRSVARRLRATVRDADIVFRIGGEEFLVLLPDAGMSTARQVAQRLRHALAEHPVEFRGRSIVVTASFGITTLQHDSDDWDALLRRADRAVYRAKENGRNRVETEGRSSVTTLASA